MKTLITLILFTIVFGFFAFASYESKPTVVKEAYPKTCVVIATMENNNITDLSPDQMILYDLTALNKQSDTNLILNNENFILQERGRSGNNKAFRLYSSKRSRVAIVFDSDKNTILLFSGKQYDSVNGIIVNCFSE